MTATSRPHVAIAEIEAAMGRNLEDYVNACRATVPAGSADSIRVGAAVAAFTGRASPLTTVKGIGPRLRAHDLDTIETFLRSHGADRVTIEAAPWLDTTSERHLLEHGYLVTGTEDVVTRAPSQTPKAASALDAPLTFSIETISPAEWPEVMRRCYELDEDSATEVIAAVPHLADSRLLGLRESGQWVACAQAVAYGAVVVFGNDGTGPAARRRGAQTALIAERVLALPSGATAVAEVEPDGASERNYLRCGFAIAYTRTHYSRPLR